MRLILNADDFGISPTVNRETCRLMDAGRITSATILANAPHFVEAVRAARERPHCSFGLHLNISEFAPLTDGLAASGHLDDTGTMRAYAFGNAAGFVNHRALLRELSAQIERVLDAGLAVSHVDSHFHRHVQPFMLAIVFRLLLKYRIGAVRIAQNLFFSGEKNRGHARCKKAVNFVLRSQPGIRTTDFLGDYERFTDRLTRNEGTFAGKTTEVFLHPGAKGSEAETAFLESDWLAAQNIDVRLITYDQL